MLPAIEFDPPLPEVVAEALGSITYGHAAKLFLPFRSDPAGVPPSATLAVPDRYWAWTATAGGPDVQPAISAFSGSSAALDGLGVAGGPEAWAEKLVALRPDLDLDAADAVLSTWDDDPWVGAAYSVETTADAHAALSAPHGRLAFAGEHLGGEMSALMEGAIRSGRHAAASIG